LRRLFPEFLTGWPALGLLLLRLAVTAGVFVQTPSASIVERGAALLVLLGLATPLCGALVALLELGQITSALDSSRAPALVAAIAVALALVGPGGWSIDARLFGWREIRITARRKTPPDSQSH
jgi:putative oxidoreductase